MPGPDRHRHLFHRAWRRSRLDPEKPPTPGTSFRKRAQRRREQVLSLPEHHGLGQHLGHHRLAGGWQHLQPDLTKALLDTDPCYEALSFAVEMFQNNWVPKEGAVGSDAEAAAVTPVDYWIEGKSTSALGAT